MKTPIKSTLAGTAALAFASFAPMTASAHSFSLSIDDHEDLLEQLIELDADEIEDLREDLVDARADIAEAIGDIEEAKEEVRDAPFGGIVAKIAFRAASATVSEAVTEALSEARVELGKAEDELEVRRTDLGEAEYTETKGAITMIHEELGNIEDALVDLLSALKEA